MNRVPSRAAESAACPEEREPQSAARSGVVRDAERLSRVAYRPEHVTYRADASGVHAELTPAAVPVADFLNPARRGASVFRMDHLTVGEVDSLRSRFGSRPGGGDAVFFVTGAESVRGVDDADGNRLFCVVDDATPEIDQHALVRFDRRRTLPNKVTARRYRDRLIALFRPCRGRVREEVVAAVNPPPTGGGRRG